VAGLNFGADDYIAKPFSLREVVARVCSVAQTIAPFEMNPTLKTRLFFAYHHDKLERIFI